MTQLLNSCYMTIHGDRVVRNTVHLMYKFLVSRLMSWAPGPSPPPSKDLNAKESGGGIGAASPSSKDLNAKESGGGLGAASLPPANT